MDLSWLVRARWRLVGAWMWPAFVVLAFADALIGHVLPLSGSAQSVVAGLLLGLILNLIAITAFALPAGLLLRLRRHDLPLAIARNYAGVLGIVLVTLGLLAIGLGHHSAVISGRATMRDAAARAAAYIGDHAPAQFRGDLADISTVVIQGGTIYRGCATNPTGTRQYCVIVNERLPAGRSVTPDGSETNQTMARGLG